MILPAAVTAYPLSPLQQGMLFHHLVSPRSGVDIEQMLIHLKEEVNANHLRRAWQEIVQRHDILRTSFQWEGTEASLQVIHAQAEASWKELDWSPLQPEEQQSALGHLLGEDRRQGFDLNQAPLMRLVLIRMGPSHWALLWTFHHILLDGRSFPIVLREVFTLYRAFQCNSLGELPQPRPYRDYIDWLQGQDLSKAETYWKGLLKGFTAATPLVVDHPPAPTEDMARQGDEDIFLTPETTSKLAALARQAGVTMNTLAQGAWSILLSRYSGESDIVFGATRACRHSTVTGAEDMVGLFINTLPMRVQVSPQASLIPWLQELRAQWVAMRPFEHTPLARIQSWSDTAPGQPLFHSILVFENYQLNALLQSTGPEWEKRDFRLYEQTNFPITLAVYAGERLCLRIEYDRGRLETGAVQRMVGHLATLLEGMADRPQSCLKDLPLLTAGELKDLRMAGSSLPPRFSPPICLHEWFEQWVLRQPEAVAVVCDQEKLTYRELNRRANRVAHALRQFKVGPDVLVGLCVERSLEMVIGILGILKASGAYLPIDLAYPSERLAFMLQDSQAPVLLTQRKLAAALPDHQAHLVFLDDLSQCDDEASSLNLDQAPLNEATDQHLAYVIYTSGSTGKPKGSPITHFNVTRLFRATEEWFHFSARDVWTLFHSCAFDFSVWELWGALLYGGRLVVVPYLASRSPEKFLEILSRQQVTVLNQTPSAFRQLIQAEEEAVTPPPLALRWVIFGGEALEMQSLRPWFDRHGDQQPQLVNMYGITETTVHVTYRSLSRSDLDRGSVIGRPIPDMQVLMLDPHGHPTPLGVPGEIHVGGAGLGRGYLRRPDLTAERFIANAFGTTPGERLYRSGDLGRLLPSGDIEYLGRIDHQVKIRGFRIELGEIEAVLCQHPDIREALVLAREDSPGNKRLVAYLVSPSPPPLISSLRDHLRVQLPDYMVPAAYVFLDRMPLTNNGKIDRRQLPVPDEVRPELISPYAPPRTSTEKILANIWTKVLRLEKAGIHDNFFELGGDSILCIQVISRARQAGLVLSAKQLFKHPTIAELAAQAQNAGPAAPPTETEPETGLVPLTPIQQWFFEQKLAQSQHWNQAFIFTLSREYREDILGPALRALKEHHAALRLKFTASPEGWRQEYSADDGTVPLLVHELSHLSEREAEATIERVARESQAGLDLTRGHLLRAVLFKLAPPSLHRLLLIVHHLAVDGVSWQILLQDLEAACSQLLQRQPIQLSHKTTSYRKWSEALRAYAHSDNLQAEIPYWKSILQAEPVPLSPDIQPPGENTEASCQTWTLSLSPEETSALLNQVPQAYNTQINDVLLASLALALIPQNSSRRMRFDLEGHGREDIGLDLSRTTGWFTSIFPVCLELPSSPDAGAILKSVKEQLRKIPHRGFGYGVLRYLHNDPSIRAAMAAGTPSPLLFNYLGQFDQVLPEGGRWGFAPESAGPWHSPQASRRYLIELNCWVRHGRMEFCWIFSQKLHYPDTIQRYAQQLVSHLRSLIQHCQSPDAWGRTPSDFPLAQLDQPTLDQLLMKVKGIEDIYPLTPMQQLFYTLEQSQAQIGFDQWHCRLEGPIRQEAFARAWELVINRHPILRTAFVSDDLPAPLQVVHSRVPLAWTSLDWRDKTPEQQMGCLEEWKQADRQKGFEVSCPPLTRLTLIRLADSSWELIWSHHHLQIDGWSWPLVFKEVSLAYQALVHQSPIGLPPLRLYRDYVEWYSHYAEPEAEAFWKSYFLGWTDSTPLPASPDAQAGAAAGSGEEKTVLPAELTQKTAELARQERITLNAVLQAAWALLLSRMSGRTDVTFGAAFSGRPAELPGVETIVGPFVSNLPVRIAMAPDEKVRSFLLRAQARQLELNPRQFVSLMQIHEWTGIPERKRLFESLLVFQNYVVEKEAKQFGSDLAITRLSAPIRTNYPLTMVAVPGPELELTLIHHQRRVGSGTARQILTALTSILGELAANADQTISELHQKLHSFPSLSVPRRLADPSQAIRLEPRNEMEKKLAAIWQEAFQIEKVGVTDNFFDLGGHSLLMVKVHARLQKELQRPLSIVKLFQFPTIRSLARFLEQPSNTAPANPSIQDRANRQREALAQRRNFSRRGVG